MSDVNRLLYLRIALIVIGLFAIFGFYPLTIVWPSGWAWGHGHSHYLMMIIGVYATLGVFLLIAARNPDAHKSLIWFTVWSSVVHVGFGPIAGIGPSARPAKAKSRLPQGENKQASKSLLRARRIHTARNEWSTPCSSSRPRA